MPFVVVISKQKDYFPNLDENLLRQLLCPYHSEIKKVTIEMLVFISRDFAFLEKTLFLWGCKTMIPVILHGLKWFMRLIV